MKQGGEERKKNKEKRVTKVGMRIEGKGEGKEMRKQKKEK